MKNNQIVTPSSQVDSSLPRYVYENYTTFVNFMTKSAESEERIGFGQDILQNLQKYRNFDTYKNQIVQFGTLKQNISSTDDELTLEDGFGFPDTNGVLLIDDEVILYQSKEGNTFYGLERGASGTKVLPTLRTNGTYLVTKAAAHNINSQVTNLSVMFLVAMLDNMSLGRVDFGVAKGINERSTIQFNPDADRRDNGRVMRLFQENLVLVNQVKNQHLSVFLLQKEHQCLMQKENQHKEEKEKQIHLIVVFFYKQKSSKDW